MEEYLVMHLRVTCLLTHKEKLEILIPHLHIFSREANLHLVFMFSSPFLLCTRIFMWNTGNFDVTDFEKTC